MPGIILPHSHIPNLLSDRPIHRVDPLTILRSRPRMRIPDAGWYKKSSCIQSRLASESHPAYPSDRPHQAQPK